MRLKTRFSLSFIVYTILVVSLSGGTYYLFEKKAAVEAQVFGQATTLEKMRSVCRDSLVASNPIAALNYVKVVKSDPAVIFA
ncbi:MAG TPA: hypothetical protein DEB40_06310, partial [Elusimicrobia bacterium]|nr:hypothetical protein [Elusimicrobiota bacterium]